MAKRKRPKVQVIIIKTLHRKLIWSNTNHINTGLYSGAPEV